MKLSEVLAELGVPRIVQLSDEDKVEAVKKWRNDREELNEILRAIKK